MTTMHRTMFLRLGAALLLAGALAPAADAQQRPAAPKASSAAPAAGAAQGAGQTFQIGVFGEWKALTTGKDKQKICYALAQPKDRKPATLKRDPGYLFVSNRLADGAKNEIAIKLGFTGSTKDDGALAVGTANFALIAAAESAFLKNPAQEGQIIEAMKKAQQLTIRVKSQRGNETIDTYSLNGFAQALAAVAKECP
ncbi:hypothetical protein [Rhabdaerophilum calidifontis]|uniref:hypothetical protein n=1 Tax=Rhabdaerophilum calidifontis TaxID=2604328 RepID=UPI00123977DB|nr:hypothetical protein [Rhabdaerophilum calidifontis]